MNKHRKTMKESGMLQRSKIIQSRQEWKVKANDRANELRESRKAIKRYKEKIIVQKKRIDDLEAGISKKNKLID
jgi:hypothetical protein